MILESFGLEKYMDEHMNSTNYLLRVMKYKGPQTSDTKLGMTAHTDKNIVTILFQNQVEGLEVQTKDGQWINVKPSPDSFIAMIGDSLFVSCYYHLKSMKLINHVIETCMYLIFCRHGQMVDYTQHAIE